MTNRQAIETFREEIKEKTADSKLSNQFLFNELLKQAKWLVKREVSGGRIYSNNSFFQSVIMMVIEDDTCTPVKTNCSLYRTKIKLPEMWIDNKGVIIRSVKSLDRSTDFFMTSSLSLIAKEKDPYQKLSKIKYTYYEDGYLWFRGYNPGYIVLDAYFIDDANIEDECIDCDNKKEDCVLFLDKPFKVPSWLEAEVFAKALQQIVFTLRIQEDEQIDKNTNRKN